MLRDLRHGVRMLLQAKAWTLVVVLLLALGIGANTALFSSVNALLFRKLPIDDPDTLVRLRVAGNNDMVTNSSDYGSSDPEASTGRQIRATFSYPMYQAFRSANQTMSDLFATAPFGRVNLVVDGNAEIATALVTSGNYYRVLGVRAHLGRTITPDDDRPSASPVAVLSYPYWRARFDSDRNAVGKTVRFNNVPVTIVGVLDEAFTGVALPTASMQNIAIPLAMDERLSLRLQADRADPSAPTRLNDPTSWWLQVMGRLKPGVTAAQVEANLQGVFRHGARAGLDSYLARISDQARSSSRNTERVHVPFLRVDFGGRGVYDPRPADVQSLTFLGIVVVLILLVVCANVANLLLSRAMARLGEISVRLSMGASRMRLIRQMLTESLLLASLGGIGGVALAYWGRPLLSDTGMFQGTPGQTVPLDWSVLWFSCALTTATGIVFGIVPAVHATRLNVSAALKENSRSVAVSRTLVGRALLVSQVAISVAVLIAAGLFLRTVWNLRNVNVGFDANNVLLLRITPQLNRYNQQQTDVLYERLIERIEGVPGVRAATLAQPAMLAGSENSTSIFVHGRSYPPGRLGNNILRMIVDPSFFETMRIPVVAGRSFTARDDRRVPPVAIINEAAARRYFPGESPLGQRFGSNREESGRLEVVGIVRDARYNTLREAVLPTMYVPYLQNPTFGPFLYVRTIGDPAAMTASIREMVRGIDPNLPLTDISTQMDQIERRFQGEKVLAQAYAFFGGLALLVASVGLFGLMSYSVARRTNEIGIRMAVGADRWQVLNLVLKESLTLVIIGIVIGVAAALAAGRLIGAQLFGITPTDPITMIAAVGAMAAVSAVAGYLPARRAARVDPLVALRYE